MLFKLPEFIRKTDNLMLPHKGIVVDNNDPEKLNRVKCIIKGIFETENYDDLPWIHPITMGNSANHTHPPEIGSELWVEFPLGRESLYQPVYKGYWYSKKNAIANSLHSLSSIFGVDYPDAYGSVDSTGNYYFVNKKEETFDAEHSSGDHIRINKNGEIVLTGKHKFIFENESDITFESKTGNLNITVLQKATIQGTAGVDIIGSLVKLAPDSTVANSLIPMANGVVTGITPCIFGPPHSFGSTTVLASP